MKAAVLRHIRLQAVATRTLKVAYPASRLWGGVFGAVVRSLSSHGDDHLSKDEVVDRVLSVDRSFPKVDPSSVIPDVHFQKDLGLDSLGNVEIVMLEITDLDANKINYWRLTIEDIHEHPMSG